MATKATSRENDADFTELERLCHARIKNTCERSGWESNPAIVAHLVSLWRPIHALAAHALTVSKNPAALGHIEQPAPWRYREYLHAVFMLNGAVDDAAKSGQLLLRDARTGVTLQSWQLPSKELAGEWEQALLDGRNKDAANLIRSWDWPLLQVHFSDAIAVSQEEFSAWAREKGIATADGGGSRSSDVIAGSGGKQDSSSASAAWKVNARKIGKELLEAKDRTIDKLKVAVREEMTVRHGRGEKNMTKRGGKLIPSEDSIKKALAGIKA